MAKPLSQRSMRVPPIGTRGAPNAPGHVRLAASVNLDATCAPQVTTLLRFEVLGLCSAAWRKTQDTSIVQCAQCACVTTWPPFMYFNTANSSPFLLWSLHCCIHALTGRIFENNWTPRFKERRLHGELVQNREICRTNPQIQSYLVPSGQTFTANIFTSLFGRRICCQTHVLAGSTTFVTE